eukprot:scaffold149193_cov16-Tisochrysis_lutea.AAC.1
MDHLRICECALQHDDGACTRGACLLALARDLRQSGKSLTTCKNITCARIHNRAPGHGTRELQVGQGWLPQGLEAPKWDGSIVVFLKEDSRRENKGHWHCQVGGHGVKLRFFISSSGFF